MLAPIEILLYWFHAAAMIWILLMPITNLIAIWYFPLKIFNIGFFIICSILQLIFWPECKTTWLQNQVRARMNPPLPQMESFGVDICAKLGIKATFQQIVKTQIIFVILSVASFFLWLL